MQRENWGSKDRLIQFLFAEVPARCRKGEGGSKCAEHRGHVSRASQEGAVTFSREGIKTTGL